VSAELPPPEEGPLIKSVYYLYLAVAWTARSLPERFVYALAEAAGRLKARFTRKQARLVAKNMARITGKASTSPEVQALVTDAYSSYGRYWMETFRYADKTEEFWLDRFVLNGREHLDAVLAQGRGAVVVVPHCGNWDAAGAYMGSVGMGVVTVAEVLRPRRLYHFFVDHRTRLGIKIYPATRGITRTLVRELEHGALMPIVGDRDLKGDGPQVTFFGETASFPGGPAALALRAGVPLLTAAIYSHTFDDGRRGWTATVAPPIELPEDRGRDAVKMLTQRAATMLEDLIAEHPEEWHVFSPFWLVDRT
jgi:KDO2-lipid IV(A) lauroyltransferase